MGRDPTHLGSHHHVHTAPPERLVTFAGFADRLRVPLRGRSAVAYGGAFFAQWRRGASNHRLVSRKFLLHLIGAHVRDGFTEIGCHPARRVGDFESSCRDERAIEPATLTEPGLRQAIAALGVELVSFHAWQAGAGPESGR